MDYTHLGRSRPAVSRLCLGTMNFGPETERGRLARDHGRRPRAGHQLLRHRQRLRPAPGKGGTEEIIGNWFAQGGGRREKTVLATKVYGEMADWPNNGKLSALNIRRALDASLKRLQTDYIDLYQFHHVDRRHPWDEIWQAMETRRRPGQGPLRRAAATSPAGTSPRPRRGRGRRNFTGLVSEQSIYNLLIRDIELEVMPAAQAYGLGVIPWSPAAGRPARRRAAQAARRQRRSSRAARPNVWRRTATRSSSTRTFADELGHEPGDVGLAWLLHQPAVTAPIVGPAHHGAARRRRARRSTSRWTPRRSAGSTRSSRGTRPPPRTTPGSRHHPPSARTPSAPHLWRGPCRSPSAGPGATTGRSAGSGSARFARPG